METTEKLSTKNSTIPKYENVYIQGYQIIPEARAGLKQYFELYNTKRLHESLGHRTPGEIYWNPEMLNLKAQLD